MSVQHIAFLDKEINPENLEKECLEILEKIKPSWNKEDVKFKALTEGFVNTMMLCHLRSDEDAQNGIVFRIHREDMSKVLSRKREFVGIQIASSVGVGPHILARFKNGICLTYLPGRTLKFKELHDQKFMRLICKALARLHAVDVHKLDLVDYDGNPCHPDETFPTEEALDSIIHNIPPYKDIKDENQRKSLMEELPPLPDLVQEFDSRFEEIKALNFPTTFCHNDIHHRNMIYDETKEEIHFVDYEGYGKNYQIAEVNKFMNVKIYFELIGMASPDDKDFDLETYTVLLKQLLSEYYLIKNGDGFVSDLDLRRAVLESQIYSMVMDLGFLLFFLFAMHNPIVKFQDTCEMALIAYRKYSSKKHLIPSTIEEYKKARQQLDNISGI